MHQERAQGAPNIVLHRFKNGGTDPSAQVVPAKIVARLEAILAEAKKRKDSKA